VYPASVPPPLDLAHLHALARSIPAWKPHAALTVNQATLRVVRFEGPFPDLHTHDVDECYVVLEGELLVELDGGESIHVAKGDACVVRAGTRHRPHGLPHASILLVT
jgi:mannose-6-phosphate isomerase-like protein (cupin superfamily)